MLESLLDKADAAVPILPQRVGQIDLSHLQEPQWKRWAEANGFTGEAGQTCLLPDRDGGLAAVLVAYDPEALPWSMAEVAAALPAGSYSVKGTLDPWTKAQMVLGWMLGHYRFDRYKEQEAKGAKLVWPQGIDHLEVLRLAEAIGRVRDLINTPAEDMGPTALAEAAMELGKAKGAAIETHSGPELLEQNFPMVHTVGRASADAPRLVTLRWNGDGKGPHLALVGKGVCFDSGGLDIKPAEGMKIMKKDMGGAAHALALAGLIMDAQLPLRLTLVLPIVENAISGNAFRPLDVLTARNGTTVEVGNTDAEGRLILADAITYAGEQRPDLLLDFATLTGAARVALGTELPALFCNDDAIADAWLASGKKVNDPVWRMPLHSSYRRLIDSRVADVHSTGEGGFGGAITAALFLEHFVPEDLSWAHLDLMAWNNRSRPGRPIGGEAMGLISAYSMVKDWAHEKAGR